MDIKEIIENIVEQNQTLEDMKTAITEMQEENRGMISVIKMWLENKEAK